MKLPSETKTSENNLAGKETVGYTIDANAGMIKMLMDGLYTNKVRAVIRELFTNAFDAHIAAGMENFPFDVHLPTATNPNLIIRDYGISMTHEEIMRLYTTFGASKKGDTNSMVGAFGLGSKSPFAYTSKFTVIARLDQRKRTYWAKIAENGIPEFTIIDDVYADEAQGIEIQVPVKAQDFYQFESEAKNVAVGFNPLPEVDGHTIKPLDPIYVASDQSYALFGDDLPYMSRLCVRQGCVIYPVDDHACSREVFNLLGYGIKMVIDVPIGAVSITGSREQLSMDDQTIENVKTYSKKALDHYIAEIQSEIDKCDSLIEANKFWHLNGMGKNVRINPKWKGETLTGYINLPNTGDDYENEKWEPFMYRDSYSRSSYDLNRFHIQDIPNLKFVINDTEDKTVKRKVIRFKEWSNYNSSKMLVNPKPMHIHYLKNVIGITDDQIVSWDKIPDPGPPARKARAKTGSGVKSVQGVYTLDGYSNYAMVTEMPIDYYWVTGARVSNHSFGHYINTYNTMVALGLDEKPVLFFSESACKRHKPDDTMNLVIYVNTHKDDYVDQAKQAYVAYHLYYKVDRVAEAIGLVRPSIDGSEFFNYEKRAKLDNIVYEKAQVIRELYPLAFDTWNDNAVLEYIEMRNEKLNKNP